MTTIVVEFGKFRYNCIPMGMCNSREIFQTKLYKILIRTYIDDKLVLIKEIFSNNIKQLEAILARLIATGL